MLLEVKNRHTKRKVHYHIFMIIKREKGRGDRSLISQSTRNQRPDSQKSEKLKNKIEFF